MSSQEILRFPEAYSPTVITLITPWVKKSLFRSKEATPKWGLTKVFVTMYGTDTADK